MTPSAIETIRRALAEDIGDGDITSEAFVPDGHRSNAEIVAKEDLVLAGTEAAVEVFRLVDPTITVALHKSDGAHLAPGDIVLSAGGPTRALLAAERTALNFLQQLSGIATLTRDFVDAVIGTKAVILDTRKTTPGLREF
jgi:nicotinate-nucleotide pyrophosphorylase (carboxylating)